MPKNDAVRPKRPLPTDISPAAAQAVLEAAADLAALSATLGVTASNTDDVVPSTLPVPETPEEEEIMDILGVPHLGPARRQLLADAGIQTLADLQALSLAELAGIKGVGLGNATRVKNWLASQPAPAPPPVPAQPASTSLSVPTPPTPAAASVPSPPPPRPADAPPAPAALDASPDMSLASANQEVQDLFGRITQATSALKTALSPDDGYRRLERQLAKLDNAASELAEGPDTLSAKQLQRALKTLENAASLLESAAGEGRLSAKKQELLTDTLKEQRKTLEKTLGG